VSQRWVQEGDAGSSITARLARSRYLRRSSLSTPSISVLENYERSFSSPFLVGGRTHDAVPIAIDALRF
jgi:hypothetical protein